MRNISWCPCLNTRLNFYPRIIYATYFTVIMTLVVASGLEKEESNVVFLIVYDFQIFIIHS